MSILDLMRNTADIAQTTPQALAVPSSHGERFSAALDASQAPDRYWNAQSAQIERADKIIGTVHALSGEKLLNPYDLSSPTEEEIGLLPAEMHTRRMQALREAARKARSKSEQFGGLSDELLDPDSIDVGIAAESRALRGREERLVGTGGGVGGFIGGMVGETLSPHGVASAFIPVSRMPSALAQATIAGFARNVGKEALFQAGAGMAAQAVGTAIDVQTRKAFGTEQTTAEIIEEIVGAGVGGLILGGGFRAAHLGILKLASRGVEIHPAVRDAAVLEEGAELFGNKNPLRVSAAVNEANLDAAVGNVALGRVASPDVSGIGPQGLDDAARRLAPELAARYDAAIAARDEARQLLVPDAETIGRLKQRADAADAAIAAAGPQTQEGAERLGQQARMAHELHDDAVARANARGIGAPIETTVSESIRQQLQAADLELRDLIPEINKLMKQAGEDLAAPARAMLAPDAEAPAATQLSPEGISRVRELQDMIPEYERMRDAAVSPEDKAAWQQAIDDFNGEIANIMDLDVVQAGLKQLAALIPRENLPSGLAGLGARPGQPTMQALDLQRPFVAQPAEARPGRVAAESSQDKAMDSQVKLLLERPDGATTAQREAYARALEDEKEANAALSCVGGAPI